MDVKMYDPTRDYASHKEEYDTAIQNVINSGNFINGSQVKELEYELSKYVGVKHCISCANGTDALELALLALDIAPGDKVITVAHTFVSTAEVICHLGATPIFIDVNMDDFCIDVDKLEEYLENNNNVDIKAMIVVSLYGQMPDFGRINRLALKYNITVIEDGAQSFGASYNNKKSCSMTTISTTSFFPTKPLGCYGDGGACFTNCSSLAKKIRALKNHGSEVKFTNLYIGRNSRLDTIQASILLVKLKYLDDCLDKRRDCANRYTETLKHRDDLILPKIFENRIHVWAQYTIILKGNNRDNIKEQLEKAGICISIFYPKGLHQQTCFEMLCEYDNLEVTENICNNIINLPCYGELTQNEQTYICDTLIKILDMA